ncbi:MAG: hypothetical protein J5I93_27295 [Pirellulaceae bacterium]|nr:hypothetical protein [Pirellulaceae bacterium]
MAVSVRPLLPALCLLFAAGCLTDELSVYEDARLNEAAMKAFAGDYQVVRWPGDTKPQSVGVTQRDGKFRFAYTAGDQNVDAHFVLSRIPGSQQKLLLLSLPKQDATSQASMFLVAKSGPEQTDIWLVLADSPVAQGQLAFEQGKAKAEDVKKFLAAHADQYVTANQPAIRLQRREP